MSEDGDLRDLLDDLADVIEFRGLPDADLIEGFRPLLAGSYAPGAGHARCQVVADAIGCDLEYDGVWPIMPHAEPLLDAVGMYLALDVVREALECKP